MRVRLVIAVLAVIQIFGYGVLFCAFSVLLTPIASDLRLSNATVTSAATVSCSPAPQRRSRSAGGWTATAAAR